MGQVLHRSATTTEAVRRAIQSSQASIRSRARQYGINPKTVAKWKRRQDVQDAPMGPKQAHSMVLRSGKRTETSPAGGGGQSLWVAGLSSVSAVAWHSHHLAAQEP